MVSLTRNFKTETAESKTDTVATELIDNWDERVNTFDELGLKEEVIRGIYGRPFKGFMFSNSARYLMVGYGFERPSTIQQKGILAMLKGNDLIAQAQSGTGKTAVFVISILQMVDYSSPNCQALVLAPTRELAFQIHMVMKALGEYIKFSLHVCTEGTNIEDNIKILKEGVQVVIGTPDRINELQKKEYIRSEYCKLLVLDEADELLVGVFKDHTKEIFKSISGDTQVEHPAATKFI